MVTGEGPGSGLASSQDQPPSHGLLGQPRRSSPPGFWAWRPGAGSWRPRGGRTSVRVMDPVPEAAISSGPCGLWPELGALGSLFWKRRGAAEGPQ